MLKMAVKVPRRIVLACSGGMDSMTILHFLSNHNKRNISVVHFNHGTTHAKHAKSFVIDYCNDNNITYQVINIAGKPNKNESYEAFWSTKRNEYYHSLNEHVITAHHLDDAVEWWVYSSLKGNPSLMPMKNNKVLRPFIINPKKNIVEWANRHKVPYVDDPSNYDSKYSRNHIRNVMMGDILKINPGIHKTIKKKYLLE